jgi:RimJ/RimL family protein N-acetyltransferase
VEPTPEPPRVFETARLRLREPKLTDAADIFQRWAQDAEVTRYLTWQPHESVQDTVAFLEGAVEGWKSGREHVWVIEEIGTGQLCGALAARHRGHRVNLGYGLARDLWGRGLMVEALTPVIDWFLQQPGVFRVWATCDVENSRSARVLEKLGFELEGVLRSWDRHPNISDRPRDALCYSRVKV